MTRRIAGWAVGALVATAGLLVARTIAPGRHALELSVYVLVLGGLAVLSLVLRLREVLPVEGVSEFERALEQPAPEVPRIAELDRLEREIYMGAAREFDWHFRLRPVVREIAAGRLERRGLRLDSGSETVKKLLGESLWELARPDRPPPRNRQAAGPGLESVRRIVQDLEAL